MPRKNNDMVRINLWVNRHELEMYRRLAEFRHENLSQMIRMALRTFGRSEAQRLKSKAS